MEIEEKGALTKYELMPKRKLYIAVYKMTGASYHSMSNEIKAELLKSLYSYYGVSNVKIYTVEIDED